MYCFCAFIPIKAHVLRELHPHFHRFLSLTRQTKRPERPPFLVLYGRGRAHGFALLFVLGALPRRASIVSSRPIRAFPKREQRKRADKSRSVDMRMTPPLPRVRVFGGATPQNGKQAPLVFTSYPPQIIEEIAASFQFINRPKNQGSGVLVPHYFLSQPGLCWHRTAFLQ